MSSSNVVEHVLYTPEEAAEALRLGPSQGYALMRAGYGTNAERTMHRQRGRRKLGKRAAGTVGLMLAGCRQSGLSERSVRYVHATLRVALEDAVREDLVPRNVAKLVRLSTPPRKETRILSADEGRHLLKTTKDDRLA